VCTPHLFHPKYQDVTHSSIRARFHEFQKSIVQEVDIYLFLGAEYYFNDRFIQKIEGHPKEILAINNKNHILIEFGPFFTLMGFEHLVFAMRQRGLTPIIAHPERHSYLSANSHTITRLTEVGCLFQVNSKSIMGGYGKQIQKTARELIEMGHIHLIASDAHSAEGLSAMHPKSFDWVRKTWGIKAAELLFIINPWLIINGLKTVDFFDEYGFKTILKDYSEVPL